MQNRAKVRGCRPGAPTGLLHSALRTPHSIFGIIISILLLGFAIQAQEAGTISGVVVNTWDGAPLPSVIVTVRGTTLATQTDANGRFELKNVPPGDQVLRFSRPGFAVAVVTDARVVAGQTTTVNGNLRPEFYEMEEYEVTAEAFTEQTEKILIERQNSSVMVEALGSDFLARVGAGNAAESISKISGATIVEGKFAVIRGLNDRYVTTTLNGAGLPSADPYRQSASLDLFPSQVIDRVVVAKTFTPDQPGSFTGGGVDIVTKSFPEKPFLTLSLGTSYNTQSSLNKNFLTYDGGGLDWAAMDDGTRALPATVNQEAPPGESLPTQHVGNLATNSSTFNEKFEQQLRLNRISQDLGTTQFAPRREAPPLNHNFSGAGGASIPVGAGQFGYFVGVSYNHDYSFYENGIQQRIWQGTQTNSTYRDARALSVVNWSGMVNLAYKPIENHEFGFTFFYNQNAIDDARIQDQGYEPFRNETAEYRKFNLYWTERNLHTYQIKGEHHFPPAAGLQFNWLVALTETTQDEPDARFFNDFNPGDGFQTGGNVPTPNNPARYFRALDENNRNVKLDWALPFHNWTDHEGQFKFGVFDSLSDRAFSERYFYYGGRGNYNDDPNFFLTPEQLGLLEITTNRTSKGVTNLRFNWGDFPQVFDSFYDGNQGVQALYLMMELPLFNKLRLVGGARAERTDLNVHSVSYLDSSVTGQKTNDATLTQSDLLPSAGLIYTVITNMNVRLNYSQTIARPSFRELAAYYSFDPVISDFIEGNPLLKMTSIDNYDLRWEWFPRPGELYSVSAFYKELRNAIERGDLKADGTVLTFLNRDKAKIYGLEFEARKTLDFMGVLFSPFSIGGNLSLVQSEVRLTAAELGSLREHFPNPSETRPLFDQSPYIANADLTYNNLRDGTTASVIFNIAGPRIALTKLNAEDVYEQPTPTLDFVVSQKFGRHTTLKFFAKNLLDPKFERTYGKNSDLLYSSYTKGRTFGITLKIDF